MPKLFTVVREEEGQLIYIGMRVGEDRETVEKEFSQAVTVIEIDTIGAYQIDISYVGYSSTIDIDSGQIVEPEGRTLHDFIDPTMIMNEQVAIERHFIDVTQFFGPKNTSTNDIFIINDPNPKGPLNVEVVKVRPDVFPNIPDIGLGDLRFTKRHVSIKDVTHINGQPVEEIFQPDLSGPTLSINIPKEMLESIKASQELRHAILSSSDIPELWIDKPHSDINSVSNPDPKEGKVRPLKSWYNPS